MSIKKLAGETVIYGLSSILGRMVYFILNPFYTDLLPTHEFGIMTDLFSLIAFAFVFYTYRIELAYFRFATGKSSNSEAVFNTSLSSIVVSTIFLSLLLLLGAQAFADFSGYGNQTTLVYLCVGILAFDALNEIPKAKLRLEERPMRFAAVQLTGIGVNVGLNLFFLFICPYALASDSWQFSWAFLEMIYDPNFNIGYIFVSNIIASGVVFLMLLPEWKSYKILLDKALWSKMMKYAIPMVIVGFSYVINEVFDRKMMIKLLPGSPEENQSQLGIYGANYKLAMILALFTQAFRYGAEPFFFKQKEEKGSLQSYADIAKYFFIIGLIGFLTVTLYIDFFKILFLRNEAYWEGIHVVPILLLANLFLGMYYNFSVWFKITDRTKYGAYISVGGALITIGLNLWWIPLFSYTGSAWATLICYFVMTLVCVLIGRKYLKVPYEFGKMLNYLLLGLGIFFIAAFAESRFFDSLIIKTVFNSGLLSLFLIAVWIFEKEKLLKIFSKK